MDKADFQELVWQKGRELYRDMPWRANIDPYYVLVSELMLQQTQVDRVIPKFNEFTARFPDIKTLAVSTLADVLTAWSGLGYNRRAKFLHEAAKKIMVGFNGSIPVSQSELMSLPGVGPNTAGAIVAYSFNQPVVFIETNIRTVYFHHFFENQESVSDRDVRHIVSETIDTERPREFYWALMDYGSYLKKQGAGQNDKSAHYKKQSPLEGSIRQVRGQILHVLTKGGMSEPDLRNNIMADERFVGALQGLIKEGMVCVTKGELHLTK
jgi:A/G-specific adenine glycosylase